MDSIPVGRTNPKPNVNPNVNVAFAVNVAVVMVEWQLLPQDLIPSILSCFDVRALTEKKLVCGSWRQLCTDVMDAKRKPRNLKQIKNLWLPCNKILQQLHCTAEDAETFAQLKPRYGWPIRKWDVSQLENFTCIFRSQSINLQWRHLVVGHVECYTTFCVTCSVRPVVSIRIYPCGMYPAWQIIWIPCLHPRQCLHPGFIGRGYW